MNVHPLTWNDDFKLGLPAMDADHKKLLDVCNRFLEAVQQQASLSQLEMILADMIRLTSEHFRAEEDMLDRHNYPALAAHRAEHERLLVQAEGLRARFDDLSQASEMGNLTHEAAEFLQTWLLDHIRTNDRPYCPFLKHLS